MRWLVTTLIGIALLPASWGTSLFLFEVLIDMQTEARTQQQLLLFLGGAGGWLLLFLFLGRPVRLYILGHEVTHLLAAWISGIRGGEMTLNKTGGSVTVERQTFWISLAPYLIPLYSLLLLAGVGILRIWHPAVGTGFWFPLLLGITWSFHLTFTVFALSQPQHDLTPYGVPGSFSIILLINLLLLSGAAAFSHPGSLQKDLRMFVSAQKTSYEWIYNQVFEEKIQ